MPYSKNDSIPDSIPSVFDFPRVHIGRRRGEEGEASLYTVQKQADWGLGVLFTLKWP